jgi:spindle assembly abnormal protein 6
MIQITDDTDLIFLQCLELTEQDFLVLKNEQSFNVDFQEFPNMLTQLFEHCLNSTKDERLNFKAILDMTKLPDTHFSIIESSSFKNLPHLHLRFRTASDEQTKRYLANCLAANRRENEKLREIQINLNDNLHSAQSEAENVLQK